jgi:hypothetical protein
MSNQILVITPPRCGTHLLVNSISTTLGYDSRIWPAVNDEMYDSEIFRTDKAVIGTHVRSNNKKFFEFAQGKKIITADRHPLAVAVSMVAVYKIGYGNSWPSLIEYDTKKLAKAPINSEEFINFVTSDFFKEFRKIRTDWEQYGICVNFENIFNENSSDMAKLTNYLGVKIQKASIEETGKKYTKTPYISFTSDPYLWKNVVSEETIESIKDHFPDYDMNTNCKDSSIGNQTFFNLI